MVARKPKKTAQVKTKETGECGTCVHCYDPHSKALDGSMILGRCQFREYSVFLKRDTCDKYKKKDG